MSRTRFSFRIMVPLTLIASCACTPSAAPEDMRTTLSQDSAGQMMPSTPMANEQGTVAPFPEAGEHAAAHLTFSIIDAPNGTFGYDILSDGKLLIHQTNLPGQPGMEGCPTKADAEKLATFVISKIKKGEMPPTVTMDELTTLGLKPEHIAP